jgi:pimeloyl-ACP methyl ester carboxylesterase
MLIQTGKIGLHLVDWQEGPEDRTTLLCIHGVTANARAFDGIATALLPDIRSIAVDLAGRGQSDHPQHSYGVPEHVEDMVAVLNALRLDAVAVAGWSLGSLVAMHLAATHPQRVDRLILLDPPLAPLNELTLESLGRGWKRLGRSYPDMNAAIAAWRESPILPATWDAPVEAFVRADLLEHSNGTVGHRIDARVLTWEREARVPPLSCVIPNITCPTLILRATDALYVEGDQLLSAADAERARRLFSNATTIDIPGTNHYTITLGTPESMIDAIRDFLA